MTDAPQPPVLDGVLETALYVDYLDAAIDFYGRILGFETIQNVHGRHVFFRIGKSILLIFNPEATEKPTQNKHLPVPPHGARGAGHVCFSTTRDGIAKLRKSLVAQGVAIESEFDWPNGARSLYVRDPAGNSVEFAEKWLWD